MRRRTRHGAVAWAPHDRPPHPPPPLRPRRGGPRRRRRLGDRARHPSPGRLRPRPRAAMIFTPTDIEGVVIVEVELHADERGFFARTFCAREFEAAGLSPMVAQANVSFNHRAGTLRGLHFQRPPAAEAKLVRCTRGRVYDVAVDLRPGVAHLPPARRRGARRRRAQRALRARGLRPRLPHADRRGRGRLPGERVLHAGRRRRPALGRPRPGHRLARRGARDLGEGRGWPYLEPTR
jgi:hypothetical protein